MSEGGKGGKMRPFQLEMTTFVLSAIAEGSGGDYSCNGVENKYREIPVQPREPKVLLQLCGVALLYLLISL